MLKRFDSFFDEIGKFSEPFCLLLVNDTDTVTATAKENKTIVAEFVEQLASEIFIRVYDGNLTEEKLALLPLSYGLDVMGGCVGWTQSVKEELSRYQTKSLSLITGEEDDDDNDADQDIEKNDALTRTKGNVTTSMRGSDVLTIDFVLLNTCVQITPKNK